MAKVVQFSTSVVGDNVTTQQVMITTVLYDDGSMYEGSMESVGGDYHNGFQYEMVWRQVALPDNK